jgi:hypothetical protein
VTVKDVRELIPASIPGVARAYAAAWRLARAFGHGWAAAFGKEEEIKTLLDSCANTHEFADRANELASASNWEYGWITAPYSPFGPYTTGSGRLTWLIEPWEKMGEGDDVIVTLEVSRPDGRVLSSCAKWEGTTTEWPATAILPKEPVFGSRHVAALGDPIHALGGWIEHRAAKLLTSLAALGDAIEVAQKYEEAEAVDCIRSLRNKILEQEQTY